MLMQSPGEFVSSYGPIGAGTVQAKGIRLFLLAVLAGFLIGMGGAAAGTASFSLISPSLARLASGLLFPFGLITVVFTGAELFTGNCLITISVLSGQASLGGMVRNLCLVYLGNLVGASALAAGVVFSGQLDLSGGALAVSVIETAAAKCALSPGSAFLRGVLCNILVCVGVMCALCAKDVPGRAVGAFCPVCFFVVCGFEHCIANLYYIPAGLFARHLPQYEALALEAGADLSALNLTGFLLGNPLPVTLGNLLGGCAFAALMWYGHKKDYSSPV